jgi:hypothetical protein
VLAAMLEAVAAFTRCFNALDAHVELSAVLSAPPPRTMTARRLGHLWTHRLEHLCIATLSTPPPRLRSALLYAMGFLSDPPPASTLADRAQYGARPLERPAQRVGGYARLPLRFSTL